MSPPRPPNPALQALGGIALGVGCALLLKALIWLVPLMMFVGD